MYLNKFGYIIIILILIVFIHSGNTEETKPRPATNLKKDTNQANLTKNNKQDEEELEEEIEDLNDKIKELQSRVDKLSRQVEKLSALEISGFFDVSISNYKNKPNVYSIGDFELNIEHNYKDHFQVAAALVFNNGAELAVGFIDYHLFGSSVSPRGRLFSTEGIHIQIGKFDVPFGNDWQNFLAIDRISVTPPLTTEMVMEGGYNDEGIRMLASFVSWNATLFMVDGIEEKYSYGGNSFGGRIGITPFNNPYILKEKGIPAFELGFSYIHDIDNNGYVAEQLYAFDLESKISPLIFRTEYYNRDKNAGVVFDGFHITCALELGTLFTFPIVLYSRYDYFRMKNYVISSYLDAATQGAGKDNNLSRITNGFNINIADISYLKLEYQRFLRTYSEYRNDEYFSRNLFYTQLVISF
ncbi:MAG: hypothetical protein SVZ03_11595 [Spirochaetota bacterium]|nr:hypothetical protein [Spirochaetota bacterium]